MGTAITKKQLSYIVGAICLTVTVLMGAMSWVEDELETHSAVPHASSVSHIEFQMWVETQVRYNEQVIDRLQSIEEAIRSN